MTTKPSDSETTFLLTGATGAFGRFLARELLKQGGARLVLLVRGASQEEAAGRVREIVGEAADRVEVLRSDLVEKRLGLSDADYARLSATVTHVLHSAASVRFDRPIEEARLYNVEPLRNMLEFAKGCSRLKRFGFVGTALVAGNRSGVIKENEFEHGAGFKNTYEESKYEAEGLARAAAKDLPVAVFRPPLLLTPSSGTPGGSAGHSNLLILSARLVAEGTLAFLPGSDESAVDVVDGRVAARAIIGLMLKPSLGHLAYHIANGEAAPRVRDIRALIERRAGHAIPLEFCGSAEAYLAKVRRIPWYRFKERYVHKKVSSFITEAAYPKTYDSANTLAELGLPRLEEDPMRVIGEAFDATKNTWRFSA